LTTFAPLLKVYLSDRDPFMATATRTIRASHQAASGRAPPKARRTCKPRSAPAQALSRSLVKMSATFIGNSTATSQAANNLAFVVSYRELI